MEARARSGGAKRTSLEDGGRGGDDDSKSRRGQGSSLCKRVTLGLLLIPVLAISYLAYQAFFASCIIDPKSRDFPNPPPLTGVLSPDATESIADAKLLYPDLWVGPECMDWDADGVMYTATLNGEVWKLDPGSDEPVLVGRTGDECDSSIDHPTPRCGRPLGLRVMHDNTLLIADGFAGLVRLSLTDGRVQTLVAGGQLIDGKALVFADDLAVGPDGSIYFSDATTKYPMHKLYLDVFEGAPNGRLMVHRPATGQTAVIADNLYFPNGVELSHDGASLLVPETTAYRVQRFFLDGREPRSEVLIENLPGYPDNIRRHPDGGYLVALSAFRTPISVFLDAKPYLRRLLINVVPYDELIKATIPYGLCVHVSEEGKIVRSWHDPKAAKIGKTSQCAIHEGHMYIGSYQYRGMAKLPLVQSLPKQQVDN